MNANDSARIRRWLYRSIILVLVLAVLAFGILSLVVAPAPNPGTATEVAGRLDWISDPNPVYGDLTIRLTDGHSYYINQATQLEHLNWEKLTEDVRPGETIYLTVVKPYAWELFNFIDKTDWLPVAGVRTAGTIYMDPEISAETWTAQENATRLLLIALAGLIVAVGLQPIFFSQKQGPVAPLAL